MAPYIQRYAGRVKNGTKKESGVGIYLKENMERCKILDITIKGHQTRIISVKQKETIYRGI